MVMLWGPRSTKVRLAYRPHPKSSSPMRPGFCHRQPGSLGASSVTSKVKRVFAPVSVMASKASASARYQYSWVLSHDTDPLDVKVIRCYAGEIDVTVLFIELHILQRRLGVIQIELELLSLGFCGTNRGAWMV